MLIPIINPPVDDLERTFLSAKIPKGATSLPLDNNNGFGNNLRLLIGDPTTEGAEMVTCNGVSGNDTATLSAGTVFSHPVDTPVYVLRFDQIKLSRSTTGINGTYADLTTLDIDWDNEDSLTFYDDTGAVAGYYYKAVYYNSISLLSSDASDPIPAGGYTRKHVGRIIDDLMEELGLVDQTQVSRPMLMEWMNEVNDDLETRTSRPYQFLKVREAFPRVAGANTLDYPTDDDGEQKMWKFDMLEYNFQDSTTTPVTNKMDVLRVISLEEFIYNYPDNTTDSTTENDQAQVLALDDAQQLIRYWPPSLTSASAVFYLHYWKYITRFITEGQQIETPGAKIYKDYCRGKFYRRLGKKETSYLQNSDRFMNDYQVEVGKLQKANRKDAGSPRSFGMRGTRSFRGFRRY